jgi:hypothetical protein
VGRLKSSLMVRALRQLPRSPLRITSITICSNLYTAMSAASAVIVQTRLGLHLRSSRLTFVSASVFGGADRNFAYSRIAHKMGTFGRIASHVDSKFWNLLRSDWANGRRANDLKRVSIIVMFVWTSQQVQQITYTHSNRRIFSSAQRFQLFAACFALYYIRDADVLWTIKKRQ